jgi:KDO2-lipid IV(A) lauroyltransferase
MSISPPGAAAADPSPLWVRAFSRLPFPLLYGLASFVAFLSHRVFPHRMHVVRENLTKAFPDLDEASLRSVIGRFYLGFAQIAVEILKGATLPAGELRRRVRAVNMELPRAELAQGRTVLLMTAHQCNWEWQLQALALGLGYPYYVAYKPLRNAWAERLMYTIRTRFGAHLLPAPQLIPDLLKNKDVPRGISLAVDQEPPKDERKHWVHFLNRDTAFYMGADRIARATGHPVFFVHMRRISRGYYEIEFRLIAAANEKLRVGELTERYARDVEAQIRRSPPDWPWSHKRWRLSPRR